MIFSPDSNFGSVPPPADENFDDKWGTGGLSLEGDEVAPAEAPVVEAEPEPSLEELGERFSVNKKVEGEGQGGVVAGEDVASIEQLVFNPYNLATEAYFTDKYGDIIETPSSFSPEQEEAIKKILPQNANNLRYLEGETVSDFKVMEVAVNKLKDKLKEFEGTQEDLEVLSKLNYSMKKSFPDFSLGENIRVTLNNGTVATFK